MRARFFHFQETSRTHLATRLCGGARCALAEMRFVIILQIIAKGPTVLAS